MEISATSATVSVKTHVPSAQLHYQSPTPTTSDDYVSAELLTPSAPASDRGAASVAAAASQPSSSSLSAELWDEAKSLFKELVRYSRVKSWKKKVLTAIVALASLLVFYDLLFGNYIYTYLKYFIKWMTHHSIGAVFAFVAVLVISTLIFIPPALLIFGSGYAFCQAMDGNIIMGSIAALFSCFLGSVIGAMIAFLRARYLMRDLIYLFAKRYPLVRAADRALKRKGFRIMLLFRLCPLIPFNALNYCCGITGIVPFQFLTVVVGATAGSLVFSTTGHNYDNKNNEDENQSSNYDGTILSYTSDAQLLAWIIVVCSGIAFGLIALVYTWRLVKKEFQRELKLTDKELQSYLHRYDDDGEDDYGHHGQEPQQGIEIGIETSYIEASQSSNRNDKRICGSDQDEEEDEEWFWVWT